MVEQDYATVGETRVHRSDFAYAPEGTNPSEWKLPVHDAAHVRNALARYRQTDLPAGAKSAVIAKIKAAAKKFGVEVSEKSSEFGVRGPGRGGILRSAQNDKPRTTDDGPRTYLSEVKNGLVRIAVAYTGEFVRDGKKFSITHSDLKEMARNLEKREAPVDYEHLSALPAGGVSPGWAKAAGWIRKPDTIESGFGVRGSEPENKSRSFARAQDDSLPFATNHSPLVLWAWAELTPAALAMVKQKEYRYFSPEIHWNDVDEQGQAIGTRLAAGALTNRPFLKELPPIEVSDADYQRLFGLAPRADGRLAMVALSEVASGQRQVGAIHELPLRATNHSPLLLLDLDSVHVPAASKDISVAYHQPSSAEAPRGGPGAEEQIPLPRLRDRNDNGPAPAKAGRGNASEKHDGPSADESADGKEKPMTKKFSFRKLAEGPEQGKFGLYKNGELLMDEGEPVVFDEEEFPAPGDEGETAGAASSAEMRAREAARLAEIFREGRVDRGRAVALAETGQIRLDSVFRAQAAEELVEQFIAEGKLLPRRRAAAFRMALADEAGLRGLLSDARPMVDFTARGLAGAPHLAGSAQNELDEMVEQWIAEHHTDYSAALTEITRRNPELWRRVSAEVSERTNLAAREDEQD